MWNAAVIFSIKRHGLQKKLFTEKNIFFSVDYVKINELHGVLISIKKVKKAYTFWAYSVSSVTYANVGISPQNFLTLGLNPFATLV